jgi:hypothetical protein
MKRLASCNTIQQQNASVSNGEVFQESPRWTKAVMRKPNVRSTLICFWNYCLKVACLQILERWRQHIHRKDQQISDKWIMSHINAPSHFSHYTLIIAGLKINRYDCWDISLLVWFVPLCVCVCIFFSCSRKYTIMELNSVGNILGLRSMCEHYWEENNKICLGD